MNRGLGCTLWPELVGFQVLVSFISSTLLPVCGSLNSSKEAAQGPDVLIIAMLGCCDQGRLPFGGPHAGVSYTACKLFLFAHLPEVAAFI